MENIAAPIPQMAIIPILRSAQWILDGIPESYGWRVAGGNKQRTGKSPFSVASQLLFGRLIVPSVS
jgi:hypothetical protein